MPASPPASQPCACCGRVLPPGFSGNTCPACLLLAALPDSVSAIGETHTIPIDSGSFIPPVRPGGNAPPQHDLEVIGPYRLLEPLGEGGFGVVYRALQQKPIRREVALKLIKPGMGSREVLARFEAERRAVALMEHPNITAVLDAGTAENGQPYFVMELVRGLPITTYCDTKRLTLRQRLELFIPVCQAVQHAHQKAVLHRDLKPSNILVAEADGEPLVKVIDFGVAKALEQDGEESWQGTLARTLDGMVVGTPQYMSPEQAGAAPDLDTRSDVYTLGIILYELLCGETPLTSESLRQAAVDEMLRRIREEEVARPSSRLTPVSEAVRTRAETRQVAPERLSRELKGDLDWIVLRALEKERERRYGSAAALAADLHRHLKNEPVEAGPPDAIYRLSKLVRRNRLAVGAAAAVLVSLVAGLITATLFYLRANQARDEALEKTHLVARSDRLIALDLLDGGRFRDAFAYLARSLEYDTSSPLAAETAIYGLNSGICFPPQQVLNVREELRDARYSRDGRWIVTASLDGVARIWDCETGKLFRSLKGHHNAIITAEYSPDGQQIVTASWDNSAGVWDCHQGKLLRKLQGHTDRETLI
jgi:serine/threonine protein kinase